MFANEEATLSIYKESLHGVCRDYVIRFYQEQCCIKKVICISSDIVRQLIDEIHQKDEAIKGRLVARMCYIHVNNDDEVMYYHPLLSKRYD